MKMLIVGGNFDRDSGRSSKIVETMHRLIDTHGIDVEVINGGNLSVLETMDFTTVDVLLWMPNISNSEDKILPRIKSSNPRLTLISSKRVVEKEYTEADIIGRLLKSKSNLGVMITRDQDTYRFKLLDPLGNCYSDTTELVCFVDDLLQRLRFVKSLNRVGSVRVGDERSFDINPDFIDFVRHSADEFSKYVNAVNPNRLLGNASTRCMFGFPAEKQDERIFVTQRNIDKKLIQSRGFVEVTDREDTVEYYGEKKPSVDTPIQVMLFNYFHNINYMVHGHVYVEGAPFTDNKIPCGFVEEFDEIVNLYPDRSETVIAVNLRGHGCLLMTDSVESLWKIGTYMSRDFPEY